MEPENSAGVTRRCSVSLMVWKCVSYHGVAELVIVEVLWKVLIILSFWIIIFWIRLRICLGMPWSYLYSNTTMHRCIQHVMCRPGSKDMMSRWSSGQLSHLTSTLSGMFGVCCRIESGEIALQENYNWYSACFGAFRDITPDYLHKLFSSKLRRVRHVIQPRGYPTKY